MPRTTQLTPKILITDQTTLTKTNNTPLNKLIKDMRMLTLTIGSIIRLMVGRKWRQIILTKVPYMPQLQVIQLCKGRIIVIVQCGLTRIISTIIMQDSCVKMFLDIRRPTGMMKWYDIRAQIMLECLRRKYLRTNLRRILCVTMKCVLVKVRIC